MEKAGYVARTADPTDKRARLVVITAKGKRRSPSQPRSRPSGPPTSAKMNDYRLLQYARARADKISLDATVRAAPGP